MTPNLEHGIVSRRTRRRLPTLKPCQVTKQALAELGIGIRVDRDTVNRAFRQLAAKHHPDSGGDHAGMQQINLARERALEWADTLEQLAVGHVAPDRMLRFDLKQAENRALFLAAVGRIRARARQLWAVQKSRGTPSPTSDMAGVVQSELRGALASTLREYARLESARRDVESLNDWLHDWEQSGVAGIAQVMSQSTTRRSGCRGRR